MPGNEIGERMHNCFGQENISQAQHHSQVVDGNWPSFSNDLWIDGQRQVGSPLNSTLKNFNGQPTSDLERGPSPGMPQGLIFPHPALRPEVLSGHPHDLHNGTNGYMHGHQPFQSVQNETSMLGLDSEPNRRSLASKGIPLNYDFLGGQQQSGHYPAILQSWPRQQAGIIDTQLLQQQALLRQMQEFHRQQQLAQQEARQYSSPPQSGILAKQVNDVISVGQINATSLHEASNNSWQSELMTADPNWLQSGIAPVLGSSGGNILPPEQGQMRMLGMVDQSLYGVPVTGTRVATNLSSFAMDKPVVQHVSPNSNSLPKNPYAVYSGQGHMHHGALLSGDRMLERNMFPTTASEGSSKGRYLGNAQAADSLEKNMFLQGVSARLETSGASDQTQERPMENASPAHHASSLDPTEEKILFGSDDNLWEAFGSCSNMNPANNMLSGSDPFGAFSSVNCGSWSALMQSAVAETCSGDTKTQAELSGLNTSGSGAPHGNLLSSTVHDSSNQHSSWIDNMRMGSTPTPRLHAPSGNIIRNIDYRGVVGDQQSIPGNSFLQSERLHSDTSSHTVVQQFLDEGNKQIGRSSAPKPATESHMAGNVSLQNIPGYGSDIHPNNQLQSWKYVDSVSNVEGTSLRDLKQSKTSQASEIKGVGLQNLCKTSNINSSVADKGSSTARDNQESSQQPSSSFNKKVLGDTNFWVSSNRSDPSGRHPFPFDRSTQILESSANTGLGKGSVDSHEMGNSKKENLHDSLRSDLSTNAASGLSDSNRHILGDTLGLPASKQKPTGQPNRRPLVARKFHYHPMGDIDLDEDPSYARATPLQPTSQFASRVGDMGYSGQVKSLSHIARNSMEARLPQGGSTCVDEASHKISQVGSTYGISSGDKSVASCDQNKERSSSQNMLELLQKVDQSRENGGESCFSSSDVSHSTVISELKSFDVSAVPPQHIQSSATQGFSLQLGPPSQRMSTPDHASTSHTVLFSSTAPTQSLTSKPAASSLLSRDSSQGIFWRNVASAPEQPSNSNLQYNMQATGFLHGKSHFRNPNLVSAGQTSTSLPVNLISDKFTSQLEQMEESVERAQKIPAEPSLPDTQTQKNSLVAVSESSQWHVNSHNHATDSARGFPMEAMSVSQPSAVHGMLQPASSLQMPETSLGNVSVQQQALSTQPNFKSHTDFSKYRYSPMQVMNSVGNDRHSAGGDRQHISPQMAPSWFNQYGLLNNGQVQPMYDAQRATFSRATEQSLMLGTSQDHSQSHKGGQQTNTADASQPVNQQHCLSSMPKTSEPFASPQLQPPDDNEIGGQKKRKIEVVPWNKLVTQNTSSLQNVSAVELEWARATNRLVDKLEEETELVEDVPPVVRSKRRLLMTTQLMQQLLRPPPLAVLSSNVTSNYETVVYACARSTLGDACGTLLSFRKEGVLPSEHGQDHPSEKQNHERISDQYVSKATEEFILRAKKLENDLLSLDQRTSLAELRVESQEIEKFSVINRFAKFHRRAQHDGAEPSNSMDLSRNYQKLNTQRYVTAIPMPSNVPDRVQCHSL